MSTSANYPPDTPITILKNIGPETEKMLNRVGIYTVGDLESVGVVEAWKRVCAIEPRATVVGLYALQGALLNIHWNELPRDMKEELRARFEAD